MRKTLIFGLPICFYFQGWTATCPDLDSLKPTDDQAKHKIINAEILAIAAQPGTAFELYIEYNLTHSSEENQWDSINVATAYHQLAKRFTENSTQTASHTLTLLKKEALRTISDMDGKSVTSFLRSLGQLNVADEDLHAAITARLHQIRLSLSVFDKVTIFHAFAEIGRNDPFLEDDLLKNIKANLEAESKNSEELVKSASIILMSLVHRGQYQRKKEIADLIEVINTHPAEINIVRSCILQQLMIAMKIEGHSNLDTISPEIKKIVKEANISAVIKNNSRPNKAQDYLSNDVQRLVEGDWEKEYVIADSFIVDLACPHCEPRTIIEVDGAHHYMDNGTLKGHEKFKGRVLTGFGWKVIRIPVSEYKNAVNSSAFGKAKWELFRSKGLPMKNGH